MAIYLSGDVDEKMVEQVSGNIKGETVYLCSPGGSIADMFVILDLLNKGEIKELIAVGEISSAAFYIFVFFRGQKSVMPLTVGLLHTIHRSQISIRADGKYANHMKDVIEIQNKQGNTFEKEFVHLSFWDDLSMPQRFIDGEDVYMGTVELTKFIKLNPYHVYDSIFQIKEIENEFKVLDFPDTLSAEVRQ